MTLLELQTAAASLLPHEKRKLIEFLGAQFAQQVDAEKVPKKGRSVLDIPAVSVGKVLRPFPLGDDLQGEMLEGRSF